MSQRCLLASNMFTIAVYYVIAYFQLATTLINYLAQEELLLLAQSLKPLEN